MLLLTSLSRWMLIFASLMQQIHWGCTKNRPHLAYLCFGSTLFNERGLDQSLASHAFFGDERRRGQDEVRQGMIRFEFTALLCFRHEYSIENCS